MGSAELRSRALARALSYGLRRAVRVPYVPLHRAAVRSYQLCAAGEVAALTPYLWDAHVPRIRGAAQFSVEHTINHFLKRKTFKFSPVVMHWLKDAMLLDGSVFSRGYRHELRARGNRSLLGLSMSGRSAEVGQAAMVSTSIGSTWWGHWLEDEVPLQLLAEQYADPVAYDRDQYRDESAYRVLLGIAEPARFGAALFRELVIVDDNGQNPDKTRRYHLLRRRLADLPRGQERIFLSRGGSGARRILVNEAEIRARLEKQGFRTLDVGSCSAQEVIETCSRASVVVSVEGSHLAPLLYLMDDFATMVILNPPYQVQTTVATVALFCSISSGMFICEPHGDSRTDFVADVEELARFVDETVAFSKANRPHTEQFIQNVMRLGAVSPPLKRAAPTHA